MNKGNILYKNYIHAGVTVHFAKANDASYRKEKVIDEIFDKLKHYEWRKINDDGDLLTMAQIRIKIRKAVNDRRTKTSDMLNQQLKGLSMEERVECKKNLCCLWKRSLWSACFF